MGIFYYNKFRLIQFKKYLIFISINNMDNISFINKDEINEKINMIMRQTDYDYDTSYSKLTESNYDHIKVIKTYLGITEKKASEKKTTSINQEIYKQIRHKLDDSMKLYNHKQEEKLKSDIDQNTLRLKD
uniref:Uncharacterized protein n=1 Tax=viral metagenome TaxID=1070528 RepID=A0A6C0HAW8_9ZZZZ